MDTLFPTLIGSKMVLYSKMIHFQARKKGDQEFPNECLVKPKESAVELFRLPSKAFKSHHVVSSSATRP